MPELPEVEVVRQSLANRIINKKIRKVIVRNRNLRFRIPKKFKSTFEKQKIKNVTRFSKFVIIELLNKLYCIIHLGMSGTIHITKKKITKILLQIQVFITRLFCQKNIIMLSSYLEILD